MFLQNQAICFLCVFSGERKHLLSSEKTVFSPEKGRKKMILDKLLSHLIYSHEHRTGNNLHQT